MKEHDLQVGCVKWFRLQYKKYGILLFSIPNGGLRTKRNAASLKAEGATSGVSDLFLSIPNKTYCGFYIEMKVGYNKQTESQKEFQHHVTAQGYKYAVIKDFDSFVKAVNDYLEYSSI